MKFLFTITFLFSLSSLFAATLGSKTLENSLIVYNSNIALVHEKRDLNLALNDSTIVYEDVAPSVNVDSVNVELPYPVKIYSQQYRYDKITLTKLLEAHVGKTVNAKVMKNAKDFKIVQAKLLAYDTNSATIKYDNKIISIVNSDIIFRQIPKSLITKPSLVWNVKTSKSVKKTIGIDYLVNNISWDANYIINLQESEINLDAWINIKNQTGKAFKDTKLYVLAGEVNRVQKQTVNYKVMRSMAMADSREVSHQAHEGYHFYTVPFKVNLSNNEKTQIKFLSLKNIPIERKYQAKMSNPNNISGERKHSVAQFISFESGEEPLPKGVVRTYSKLDATNILLGENRLAHTPKNTDISLKLGNNFDLKATEIVQNIDRTKYKIDVDMLYKIKNDSDSAKTVEVLVPFNKLEDSKVNSKEKFVYKNGNMLSFKVEVEENSTKKFKVYYRTLYNR